VGRRLRPDHWFCLPDEFDGAQDRGEVRTQVGNQTSTGEVCGPADIGLSHKEIHEASAVRDAELADRSEISQS